MGFQPFGHQPVTESGIEMPGAGGGFHKSLAVDELELDHGDRITVVVDVVTAKVRFDPVDPEEPTGELRRVHVFRVEGAAQIDRKMVAEALAEQARRVKEAQGVDELPFADGDEPGPGICPHDRPVGECTVCPASSPVVEEAEADQVDELAAARASTDG
jgi:hypothetical protein